MRRFSLPLVILGSIVIAAILTWVAISAGASKARDEMRERATASTSMVTEPFRHIDISGQAEVSLVQGALESVSYDAPVQKPSRVDVAVRDGTLYIAFADREPWWNVLWSGKSSRPPQIVVTFIDVESISTAGAVKVVAKRVHVPDLRITGAGGTTLRIDDLQTRRLRLSGAGAIKADLGGRATEQTLSISGAGEYRGARLVSENATVTVAGAGRVVINAEKTLKATISGAGSVEYLGDPHVTEHISGAGRVRKRDASLHGTRIALAE